MPNKKDLQNVFEGFHNSDLQKSVARLDRAKSYRDLSTVWICPTRGQLSPKVVASWIGLMRPMNQKCFGPIFIERMEVGAAYNHAVELILSNPQLSQFKYLLTVEEDNCPPPDGLIRLYESMDKFDVVGGLYWTKGEEGQPMIYGNPYSMPKDFVPQKPIPETVQHCNGLGMGFNLFKIEMFKKMPKPWFKTVQQFIPGQGGSAFTQDLYFYNEAAKLGYKFACDTRVKVGHYDVNLDYMW